MENFGGIRTMARKHENFSYNYGWKTAPEQWNFFFNEKRIDMDTDTRNNLACLCIYGIIIYVNGWKEILFYLLHKM